MEIEASIRKKQELLASFLSFISKCDDSEEEFKSLTNLITDQGVTNDKHQLFIFFHFILSIVNNYHRVPDFFPKIKRTLKYIIDNTKKIISDSEIVTFFKPNKIILRLLFEEQIIIPNEIIQNIFYKEKDVNNFKYIYYLYSAIKPFIGKRKQKSIEFKIGQKYKEKVDDFNKKCENGENDSIIATLIRTDSIEEFVSQVNRTNLSLTSEIESSIYETNAFLLFKRPTLIEYAAFFGSIQIIKYLINNSVQLSGSIWPYAIHSNNPELIQILEENNVHPIDGNYFECFCEAIICHHNEIAEYIKNEITDDIKDIFASAIIESYNLHFIQIDDIKDLFDEKQDINLIKLNNLLLDLKTITIPFSVTSIIDFAFINYNLLAQVIFPSSVTSIGNSTFEGCSSLIEITFPSSLKLIGQRSFYNCSSLSKISILSPIISISTYAFHGCSSLKEMTINSSELNFYGSVFCGMKELELKGNVTQICSNMFNSCKNLEKLTILSKITLIDDNAFANCSNLKVIECSSSPTSIGNKSFYGCHLLEQIPDLSLVKSIGDYSFFECKSLKQISKMPFIKYVGVHAFDGCCLLEQIILNSSVSLIGSHAFSGCSSLNQFTIPENLPSIQSYLFFNCKSLLEINIPSSIVSIGEYAFYGCSSIKIIKVPSSVTSIDEFAFACCSSLTQLEIPSSVTSIGIEITADCPLLKK